MKIHEEQNQCTRNERLELLAANETQPNDYAIA